MERKVRLPFAAPYVFTGFKLCVAYSFVGVIGAEFITSSRQKENGLLPKDNYAGDVKQQVHSLSSNAACWRGLVGQSPQTPPPEPADAAVALVVIAGGWAEFTVVRGEDVLFSRALPVGTELAAEVLGAKV